MRSRQAQTIHRTTSCRGLKTEVSKGVAQQYVAQRPPIMSGQRHFSSNTTCTVLGLIIERLTGRTLATDRLFGPLGMSRTYLPVKPPQGIVGPHGHGYYPDTNGKLRDVDQFDASFGGVVSTVYGVSAFKRAFTQGKPLPPELQRVTGTSWAGPPPAISP
ncbi:serine hydrolase domain-containing protein [Nonomuraea sp. NPDC050790]|uniref:serine hydrolase domain-containing protein n=1 Tax=Nonomuraea sp. NPDC050790 TaxID=3364371 RepID=UPI0037A10975